MCNCIKEIEESTLLYVKEKHSKPPFSGTVSDGKILQSQFPFSINEGKGVIRGRVSYSEFQYRFTILKKDGSYGKPKNLILNAGHSFCPWCGEKHPE